MTLAIVGDIDVASIDTVIQQVLPPDLLRARPTTPRPTFPEKAPEPPAPPATRITRAEASVATPELWIGWSLPRAFDGEAHMISMLEKMARQSLRHAREDDGERDVNYVHTHLVRGKEASMLIGRVVFDKGVDPEKNLGQVLDHTFNALNFKGKEGGARADGFSLEIHQRAAVVDMLLETEDIVKHGTRRALTTHFTKSPLTYTRSLDKLAAIRQETLVGYAAKYLTRERARAVLFMPADGGPRADARSIGAQQLGEDDPGPLRVEPGWLAEIAPSPDLRAYRRFIMSNGLEVVIGRREGSPSAAVQLLLRGGLGAAADPSAALMAHRLMFAVSRGDPTFPEEFGADVRRTLHEDRTRYFIDGPAGNVDAMLTSIAETVSNVRVLEHSFDEFQKLVIPLLERIDRVPEQSAQRAFISNLFAGHAYGRISTTRDLRESGVKEAADWLETSHTPNNSVLVVIGEIDVDRVAKTVRTAYDDWKKGPDPAPAPPPYQPSLTSRRPGRPTTTVLTTPRPGATQTQIQLGCILPPARTAADDVQHDVASDLVQRRLSESLRERAGVTYGIGASATTLRGGTAYLTVDGVVERSALATALTTLRDTLRQLGERPAEGNEIAWAKLGAARSRTTAYVTNRNVARAILSARNLDFPIESLDSAAANISAATPARVQDDLRACYAGGLTLSLVGDEPAIQAALKQVGLR